MPVTTPPAITALPAAPDPADRSTFNTRAYPWSAALTTWTTQVQAVAANVAANATDAQSSATAAVDAAAAAVPASATATTKAAEALASADAAEASRIAASKLNLGNKTTPPVLDNQGGALLAGATYYDTALSKWRVWSGSAWADGISAVAGVASVNGMTGIVTLPSPNPKLFFFAGA